MSSKQIKIIQCKLGTHFLNSVKKTLFSPSLYADNLDTILRFQWKQLLSLVKHRYNPSEISIIITEYFKTNLFS